MSSGVRWSVVSLSLLCFAAPLAAESIDCRLERGPERTVMRLVDAADLELDDGRVVRLASVLLPTADGGRDVARRPVDAATSALTALAVGQTVSLRFAATRRDRYDRLVAHVVPASSGGEAVSIQARLLAAGLARAAPMAGERACADALIAIEAGARAAGQGLWGDGFFRVLPARSADDVAAYAGTFQIVQGLVTATETTRDNRVRLRFGPDRRRDLTATMPANDRDMLGPLGGDVAALRGRQIEVRGWVQLRPGGGPDIDVSLAGHVRLIAR